MPRRLIALPLLSSVLYILAFPNFNVSWLAWIALVPLIFSLRRPIAPSPRQAFIWGWLSGTLAYIGILYWIVVTFQAAHLSLALACFCLLLLAGYLGLYWAAWALFLAVIASKAKQSVRSPRSLQSLAMTAGGAAAWVALEYLRTYLFSGFPWTLLADSQVKFLPLIQIASITGVYGVSFLVVLVNLTIAVIASEAKHPPDVWRTPRSLQSLAMTIGLLLSCYFYGHWRLQRTTESPTHRITIALLQGNIDQYKKWDKAYVEDIQRTYENLVSEASRAGPDIIVWPETSVPGYLLQDPPLRDWLEKVVRKSHTSHLVGVPLMRTEKAYNGSFSLNPKGQLEGEYSKRHLVPFGEVVPWSNVLGRFIKVLNDLGGFTAGDRSPVVPVAGIPVGVNICYEAIFPNLVRQSVRQGAGIIANLTNDGWYMKTAAPYQHWAPNIFRAVENSRWVVRADNTGVSGIIDPLGRVTVASPIFKTSVITGKVEPRQNLTLYTRFGDWFAWLCILLVLGCYLGHFLDLGIP